jgi:DNA invertase Pin-like site-specific DNA recombinase
LGPLILKGLEDALAFLRPGDTFVVWKLDPAGRSLAHLMELLKGLQHREISFVSLTEQIDTTTPSGKLIFHLMAALAEFERDIIRERTNAGLAAARARGNVGGRPRKLQSNAKVALAHQLFASKEHSISELCSALGISRATLYRYVKEVTPSVSNS